jgi:antitoxin CptB
MLSEDSIHEAEKLRWACRRGMRELDFWLRAFVDKGYNALSDDDKKNFVRLLGCLDQELFDWLMGKAAPIDPAFPSLIEKIKAASRPE